MSRQALSGRELYEAARRRQGGRPADPQRTTGLPPARPAAGKLNELCECGHINAYHHQARPRGPVTYCTRMNADGACGCRRFRPASTTPTGGDTPDDDGRPPAP